MTDFQLIEDLQEGKEPAFKQLVTNYQDKVYNVVIGFVQQAEDAEDIAQEIFIKVYENIRQFKGESSLETWIYRIAVTQSLDFLRRKHRKKKGRKLLRFFGVNSNEVLHPVEFNHPGVMIENREKAAILFKVIDTLPQNQKAAFLLQKLEGLSLHEIAAILNMNTGAVESLLSRAKHNLKKKLAGYYAL